MKPSTYANALAYVNVERKKKKLEPLAFIPSGKAGDGARCPLARAGVSHTGKVAQNFMTEFDRGARGLEEFDPWVLVEGSILKMKTVATIEEAPEGHSVLEEMNAKGDTKHVWDSKKPDDVNLAAALFETLTARGMQVFRVGAGGAADRRMKEFDPEAGRMIAVPQLQGG